MGNNEMQVLICIFVQNIIKMETKKYTSDN